MTAISTLLRDTHARVGYLLVIEGWAEAFTTEEELAGTGVSAWIGTTTRTVLLGLSVPREVGYAIDVSATSSTGDSTLTDTGADFRVLDYTSVIVERFGNYAPDDLDYLAERIMPTDDPAGATAIGQGGGTIDIWGRHVGVEAIGPAGERRYLPCMPSPTMPGLDHAALLDDVEGALAQEPVTDEPSIVDGRRVALYAIVQDRDGTWPSWSTQAAGGAMIWWGRLRLAARTEGRTWSLRCDGPASWLRKTLNANTPQTWRPALPVFSLRSDEGADETGIAVWFRKRSGAGVVTQCGTDLFTTSITSTDPADIAAEVDVVIQSAVSAGGGSAYDVNAPYGAAEMLPSGVMRIRIDTSGSGLEGEMFVLLHWKVWQRLGFDPVYQQVPDGSQSTVYDLDFRQVTDPAVVANGADATVPGPGYWLAICRTRELGAPASGFDADEGCNKEEWRSHAPVEEGGLDVLDHLGGQEVEMSVDPFYLDGQLGRGPSTSTIGGSATNAVRWMLLRAPYRESAEADAVDRYQVAKVSFRSVDGEVTTNGTRTAFVLDYLEPPRLFGIDDEKLDRPWAVRRTGPNGMQVLPLGALRYSPAGVPDHLHAALLRLLLSTGTASVAGVDDDDNGLLLTPGDNDHPSAVGTWHFATDAEIAELGLQVPYTMVDWGSFRAAFDRIPGGHGGDLGRGVLAWSGPRQASDLLSTVLRPRGLALGLPGGKYGLVAVYDELDPGDAVATVGSSDRFSPGGPMTPPAGASVTRFADPFDRVEVESLRHPGDGSYQRKTTFRARDGGVNSRQGREKIAHVIDGVVAVSQWDLEHRTLWGDTAAKWCARPHVILAGVNVARPKALQLWPGDVVLVTTPWPSNGVGGYGFTQAPARVLSVKRDLGDLSASVDLLVTHNGANLRRWAPIARVLDDVSTVAARYDAGTLTWKCYANAFEHGGDRVDVAGFAEPSWSSVGGSALVYGYQYDGVAWSQNFSFTVASVDTAASTITASGAYTGTWYDRQYTVLVMAPYDVQTGAWVKALHLVVTDPDGTFGGGPTKGWRLQP